MAGGNFSWSEFLTDRIKSELDELIHTGAMRLMCIIVDVEFAISEIWPVDIH